MISAVDTNVLLDVLIPNARYLDQSLACLEKASEDGPMIISEMVYAELSSQFPNHDDLRSFLSETAIELRNADERVLWESGRAWKEYTNRRRKIEVCSACGKADFGSCIHCGIPIPPRAHLLSDFLIGAHAKTFADRLITRDRGFYRNYFKGLRVLDPSRRA